MATTDLCRVCTKSFHSSDMRKLFDETNLPLALAEILVRIGGIEILVEDTGMPKVCCKLCSTRLEEADDLRKLCQESDVRLRIMVRKGSLTEKEADSGKLTEEKFLCDSSIKEESIKLETSSDGDDLNPESLVDDNESDSTEYKPIKKRSSKLINRASRTKFTKKSNSTTLKDEDATEGATVPEQPIPKARKKHKLERKTYQCSTCGRFAPNNHLLREHEATHRPERPLQCHQCPKAYARRNSFLRHLRSHDPEADVYRCDQCDKVFTSNRALKEHIHAQHTGERPFKCKQCPKAYPRSSTLWSHVQQVHYKKRPFECNLCPKVFTCNYKLGLHRVSAHEGVKLSPCPHCDKKYHSRNYLSQHIAEKHPDQLAGQVMRCAFCGVGYYSNSHYRKHVGLKHPDRVEQLEELLKQNKETV